MLGCFAGVDEPGGELDDDFVDGRAELFLQDDFRPWSMFSELEGSTLVGNKKISTGILLQNGGDPHAVDVTTCRPGSALGRFPCALDALGVDVDFSE